METRLSSVRFLSAVPMCPALQSRGVCTSTNALAYTRLRLPIPPPQLIHRQTKLFELPTCQNFTTSVMPEALVECFYLAPGNISKTFCNKASPNWSAVRFLLENYFELNLVSRMRGIAAHRFNSLRVHNIPFSICLD